MLLVKHFDKRLEEKSVSMSLHVVIITYEHLTCYDCYRTYKDLSVAGGGFSVTACLPCLIDPYKQSSTDVLLMQNEQHRLFTASKPPVHLNITRLMVELLACN